MSEPILHWGDLLDRPPVPPTQDAPPHSHQFVTTRTPFLGVGGVRRTLIERRCTVCGLVS